MIDPSFQEIRSRAPFPWLTFVVSILLALCVGAGIERLWVSQNIFESSDAWPIARTASSTFSGSVLGIGQSPSAELDLPQDVEFKQFWTLWNTVKEKYYKQPVTDKQLFYGALSGLARSVNDPYTSFFEPVTAQEFQQALSGTFEGIGAEIGMRDEQVQVIAPLEGMPAERAGIRAGDWIVKIDSTETTGMSVEKAVSLIRGPKGTQVVLTIFRPDAKKAPFEITITRDQIHVKSVTMKMLPDKITLIDLTSFNGDTYDLFDTISQELFQSKPKGIVLDLRNNPGGFLDSSLQVAGEWVGSSIVTKERRQGKIVDVLHGEGRSRLKGIPTVVLVNEGSASASEIVAGALQDYKVATLVGAVSFGKGSVQEYQALDDGSAIKITVAEWVTPNDRAINTIGLVPDYEIELTADDYEAERDPQLDAAVRLLKGESVTSTKHDRSTTTTTP